MILLSRQRVIPLLLACAAGLIGSILVIGVDALSDIARMRLLVSAPAAVAILICIRRYLSPTHPLFVPSTGVLLAFVILYVPEVYFFLPDVGQFLRNPDTVARAGVMIWLAFGALLLGMNLPGSGAFVHLREKWAVEVRPKRVFVAAVLLECAGIAALLLLCRLLNTSSLDYLRGFYTEAMWGGISDSTRPILMVMKLAFVGALLGCWLVWHDEVRRGMRIASWGLVLLPLGIDVIRGSRGNVVFLTLVLAATYACRRRGLQQASGIRSAKRLFAMILLMALPALGAMTFARDTAWGRLESDSTSRNMVITFCHFHKLVFTVDQMDREPEFLHGSTLLAAFVFPIPRAYWRGKPYGFGTLVGGWMGFPPGSVGIPSTLVGELYANGGWLGIAVGFVFFGWLLKNLDPWTAFMGPSGLLPIMVVLNMWSCVGVMRGDFLTAMSNCFTSMGIVTLVILFARRPSRERSLRHGP